MNRSPDRVGGARVLRWTVIDPRHWPTGNCKQIVAGEFQGAAAALAICQYDGEDFYHRFGCDVEWNSVTGTWHPTLEEALRQAKFEYEGVSQTWNVA